MSHSADSMEPNLTPMLDMVFQLITFFMLVINFKAQSLDAAVKLPVVGSAMPVDTKGQEEFLLLNITDKGDLRVFGETRDAEKFIANEARLARLKNSVAGKKNAKELEEIVVIRADKNTPFKLLNKVLEICRNHGFRRFSLKALNKQD